jgi:hypothetical protein
VGVQPLAMARQSRPRPICQERQVPEFSSTEINPATSNSNLPTGTLECGCRQGANGWAVWSRERRAVTTNCKENEVVVCDGKGPCSRISICAVGAGGEH